MKVYIYAESDELYAFADPLAAVIEEWARPKTNAKVANRQQQDGTPCLTGREFEIGLDIETAKPEKLKDALNFLQQQAETYQCEFVVGLVEGDSYRDVCFFGYEEGRPDVHEIANYLSV